MIREICTIIIDKIPTQYYIQFHKDRRHFGFQASLKNKFAPSFVVVSDHQQFVFEPSIDEGIKMQAIKKLKEIVSDNIFDRL